MSNAFRHPPFLRRLLSAALALSLPMAAVAAEPEFALVIRNHRFEPAQVRVPAGQKVKLIVDNQDATAEEFESKSLKREKVIPPKTKATLLAAPLRN